MSCKSQGQDATAKRAGFREPQDSQPVLSTQSPEPHKSRWHGNILSVLRESILFDLTPFQFVSSFLSFKRKVTKLLKAFPV